MSFEVDLSNVVMKENPAVLYATGAFGPLHDGHISMMEVARERVEREGFNVVGGWFGLSHESYVREKYDHWLVSAERRIEFALEKLNSDSWLGLETWVCLNADSEVNFVERVDLLEGFFLESGLGDVPVFFVYGSDNSYLGREFRYDYRQAVCVVRDGVMPVAYPNVLVAFHDVNISSSSLRDLDYINLEDAKMCFRKI